MGPTSQFEMRNSRPLAIFSISSSMTTIRREVPAIGFRHKHSPRTAICRPPIHGVAGREADCRTHPYDSSKLGSGGNGSISRLDGRVTG